MGTSFLHSLSTYLTADRLSAWATAAIAILLFYLLFWVLFDLVGRLVHRFETSFAVIRSAAVVLSRTSRVLLLIVSIYLGTSVAGVALTQSELLRKFAVAALILQGGMWFSAAAGCLVKYSFDREDNPSRRSIVVLAEFLSNLFIWALTLLLLLDNIGINVTTLITGLGIGGIAVALAVQQVLSDLLASLSIALDSPFEVGDAINTGTAEGTVERIGMKTTRLRGPAGELIIMSNSELLRSRISNFKRMAERRTVFSLRLAYDTPADKLKTVPAMIKEIISNMPHALFDRAHFKTISDTALVFEVVYLVRGRDYNLFMDTQQEVNLAILERFAAEGIKLAVPAVPPAPVPA